MIKKLNSYQLCYVTTIGRRTKRKHTVELWFVFKEGIFSFLSHIGKDGEPTDWVKNLQANPEAIIDIGGYTYTARLEPAATGKGRESEIRRAFIDKYGEQNYRIWYGSGERLPISLRLIAEDKPETG